MHMASQPAALVLYNPILHPEDPEKVARRWGSQEEADRHSPLVNLPADLCPTIVFFGTADPLYPQGHELLGIAADTGLDVVLRTADGEGHGFFNRDPWRSEIIEITDRFLAEQGFVTGEPTIVGDGTVSLDELRSSAATGS